MEQQSTFHNTIHNAIKALDAEFHDAVDQFLFVDASNSFEESDHSVTSSDQEEKSTITVISEHLPDSPSSPSSAGLRHRRHVSCNKPSQSQFFKNNPNSFIDFDPHSNRSSNLNDNEKLNDKLNSTSVELSSNSPNSEITSVSDDEMVNEQSILTYNQSTRSAITGVCESEKVNEKSKSTAVDSHNTAPDLLSILAELVVEVVTFQTKLLANCFSFPLWLIHSSYMLVYNPYWVIELGGNYILENVSEIYGICYNGGVKLFDYIWVQNHESALKLCVQIGWGVLWLAYCGLILVCLLVPAFVSSGVMMKWIVEEPVQITEQLTFDYTKDSPVAFVPVISCPESSYLVQDQKSRIGSFVESRGVPFDHELMTTVSLVLPESDYNRNLGIFQVRIDFLSGDGKLLATTRKPSMLQFKSDPIRLLSTFVKLASVLTGYPSETQTLDIKFNGYTEKEDPLSCLRVVIEQRAEFAKGGGVPEIYSASLKLESQFPFLKRMLWYWKGLIYMWISTMMFIIELLITLLCCTPVIFPWVRRLGGSSVNNASHNKPAG